MKTTKHVLSAVAVLMATHATAAPLLHDEDGEVLARNKELSAMEFKRDQMRLQAEMATSIKEMIDAGVLVDEEGNPLGIESLSALAADVRDRAKSAPADNPFSISSQMPGMPFNEPPATPVRAEPQPDPKPAKPVEFPKPLQLVQINGDSVIVRTPEGEQVVRVGEKVGGLTLTRFDASRAFLKGKNGTQVLRIDWARSGR